nr:hypothetical protein K-LCC10_0100 [Kaumoebavirus]
MANYETPAVKQLIELFDDTIGKVRHCAMRKDYDAMEKERWIDEIIHFETLLEGYHFIYFSAGIEDEKIKNLTISHNTEDGDELNGERIQTGDLTVIRNVIETKIIPYILSTNEYQMLTECDIELDAYKKAVQVLKKATTVLAEEDDLKFLELLAAHFECSEGGKEYEEAKTHFNKLKI